MTAPGLLVHRITPLCQLQDLGRIGYQRFGVSRSGAMDPYSLRLANILAGNPQGEGCLELALAGAVFEVTARRLHFAFVGNFPVIINDEAFPANASYTLTKGERLEIGASDGKAGTHGYLAVLGGFDVEPQLGSLSTHLRSGIGGFSTHHPGKAEASRHPGSGEATIRGRDPRIGKVLRTRLNEAPLAIERQAPETLLRTPTDTLRAVPGPQTEWFSKATMEQFFDTRWHIAPASDRMGYRLGGGTVVAENAGSMISEPVSPGSIQIPANGQPIVLMADCGTVGGYPKIATIISVDRGRMAQMGVGREFGIELAGVEQAQNLLRSEKSLLEELENEG